MSANSSTTTTIDGRVSRYSSSSGRSGLIICLPLAAASSIFLLNPAKFLTPIIDINLYLLSISTTHHLRPLDASVISVITGVSKCGIPSYTDSSSIFGSMRIKRTSFGSDLNNKLNSMALTPTDLPDPVVPATRR